MDSYSQGFKILERAAILELAWQIELQDTFIPLRLNSGWKLRASGSQVHLSNLVKDYKSLIQIEYK